MSKEGRNKSVRDDFLKQEMTKLLRPGETILNTGTVFTGPIFLAYLFGPLGQLLMLKHYYAVLTNKRLILIGTKPGFTGHQTKNRGVTEFLVSELKDVQPGGVATQRNMTIHRKDGGSTTIRFHTLVRQVEGQKAFCSEVPEALQRMIQEQSK